MQQRKHAEAVSNELIACWASILFIIPVFVHKIRWMVLTIELCYSLMIWPKMDLRLRSSTRRIGRANVPFLAQSVKSADRSDATRSEKGDPDVSCSVRSAFVLAYF
jgi:hypothetical protein